MSKPNKATILYVDDMVPNINVFKITFKRHFNIITAESAEEAIKILSDESIDLLITDHFMPQKTGLELIEEVNQSHPDLPKMIISEYSKDAVIRSSMAKLGILQNIHKPWDRDEVMAYINEAVKA